MPNFKRHKFISLKALGLTSVFSVFSFGIGFSGFVLSKTGAVDLDTTLRVSDIYVLGDGLTATCTKSLTISQIRYEITDENDSISNKTSDTLEYKISITPNNLPSSLKSQIPQYNEENPQGYSFSLLTKLKLLNSSYVAINIENYIKSVSFNNVALINDENTGYTYDSTTNEISFVGNYSFVGTENRDQAKAFNISFEFNNKLVNYINKNVTLNPIAGYKFCLEIRGNN